MAGVSAEIKGLQEVQKKMEQMVRDMGGRGPLFKTMSDVLLKLERDVKINMQKDWHDTGRSMASVTPKIVTRTNEIEGVVGSNVESVPYGEFGTGTQARSTMTGLVMRAYGVGAHFPPWKSPALITWAKRHGFPNAFLVCRAIARKGGLKPRRMFQKAFEKNEGYIKRAFDQVVKLIVGR